MRTTGNPIIGVAVSAVLLLTGLYVRTQPGGTAAFMGTAFIVVGVLGIIGNLLVWRASRR
ncbi:MAG: hypothetical protein V9G19_08335 [Tetrasphaera sp.]